MAAFAERAREVIGVATGLDVATKSGAIAEADLAVDLAPAKHRLGHIMHLIAPALNHLLCTHALILVRSSTCSLKKHKSCAYKLRLHCVNMASLCELS